MRIGEFIEGMFLLITSIGGYVYCAKIFSGAQNAMIGYANAVLPSTMSVNQLSMSLQMSPDSADIMIQFTRFCLFGLILVGAGLLIHGALTTKQHKQTQISNPRI